MKLLLSLFIAGLNNAHAANFFVSLDRYDYNTNLADIDLVYEPVGATIGASFDVNDTAFFQIQYGNWSENNADVSAPGMVGSDFDSTLINISYGFGLGRWDFYASYTDLSDEMALIHGRNAEFRSAGETDSQSFQASAAFSSDAGRWSRSVRLGLQYDESETFASLDNINQMVGQENDALYATITFGADYFVSDIQTRGWFLGANASWYQELSSNESISLIGSAPLIGTERPSFAPFLGRRGPGGNVGQAGNGAVGVNRTFGDSFGVLSVYATYMVNESWNVDVTPSFGFGGDVNNNSLTLTLSRQF